MELRQRKTSARPDKTFLLILLSLVGLACPTVYALDIMQPQVYQEGMEATGWLMSEKLDGIRGYWNGRQLRSKTGLPFHPPPAFTANFPAFALEGEIWGGRGTFEKTVSIVKQQEAHEGWLALKFAIFDVPEAPGDFEERLAVARQWLDRHPSPYAFVIPHQPVQNTESLHAELQRIEQLGGEGLILRRPGSLYMAGRSPDVLKLKSWDDAEAVVVAHRPGRGRNEGRMGSLIVELPESKIRFKIGTGFSDAQRENPPPVGALVTFKYYGFYASGIPKFPSFLRLRPPY